MINTPSSRSNCNRQHPRSPTGSGQAWKNEIQRKAIRRPARIQLNEQKSIAENMDKPPGPARPLSTQKNNTTLRPIWLWCLSFNSPPVCLSRRMNFIRWTQKIHRGDAPTTHSMEASSEVCAFLTIFWHHAMSLLSRAGTRTGEPRFVVLPPIATAL